jgi:hypothetical protein
MKRRLSGRCLCGAGTLVDAPSLAPQTHISVGSKAAWHTITDTLPQRAEFG